MANIFRGKITRNRLYLISGYAVTLKGYTHGVQIKVDALNLDDAVIRATAKLRWEGLTHFKVLRVIELKSVAPY